MQKIFANFMNANYFKTKKVLYLKIREIHEFFLFYSILLTKHYFSKQTDMTLHLT